MREFLQDRRESHFKIIRESEKERLRKEIAEQTEAFLKKKKKIKEIPIGVSGLDDYYEKRKAVSSRNTKKKKAEAEAPAESEGDEIS